MAQRVKQLEDHVGGPQVNDEGFVFGDGRSGEQVFSKEEDNQGAICPKSEEFPEHMMGIW